MNIKFEQGLRDMTASHSVFTREIGSYILDGGGKRLRPKLVLLIGEALGMDEEKILPVAYSVELLHTASLLHDDVVDGTEIRRARPTANQVYGDKPALLAGDYLSASALDSIFSQGNLGLVTLALQTIKKMAEGELLEIEHAAGFHNDRDVYLQIIYLKTAALFELCAMAPALVAGLPEERVKALGEFGRCIGMSFQIVDDIINLVPATEDDKDAFNDIDERKSTLPLIYLFQEQPQVLERLAATKDPEGWRQEIVPKLTTDILLKSRDMASVYLNQAMQAVEVGGFKTPSISKLPETVLAPLVNRF